MDRATLSHEVKQSAAEAMTSRRSRPRPTPHACFGLEAKATTMTKLKHPRVCMARAIMCRLQERASS